MTDLPRKAYPLVVPPPGGFEDAVKRGRRHRRNRTGSSTGAALALVGVLAYSVMGDQGGGGADRLDTTRQPKSEQNGPAIGGEPLRSPAEVTASPTATTPAAGGPIASGPRAPGQVTDTTPVRPPVEATRPPRGASQPTLHYAARPQIKRADASPNTDSECLPKQDQDWCTSASVDIATDNQIYTLLFAVCRRVGIADGKLHFDREQQVDFTAIEEATEDAVWTYSAGQPVVRESSTVDVPAGSCVVWHTDWDGYDDFRRTPAPGRYLLVARSFAKEALPPAEFVFDHQ